MIFGKDMVEKVLSGAKTVTRRRLPVRYQVGRVYAVQPGRGKRHVGHIRVLGMNEECLGGISYRSAQAEGFESPSAFSAYWIALRGGWNPAEVVMRIHFELAPACPACGETA